MENQIIIQYFTRFNLILRPDALKYLKTRYVTIDQIEKLCLSLRRLDLNEGIVEVQHIEQVSKINGNATNMNNDIIHVIQEKIRNSLIIIDPFDKDHTFNVLASAESKIKMYSDRLDYIKSLFAQDPIYAKTYELKLPNQIFITSLGSVIGKSIGFGETVNLLGLLIQSSQTEQYSLTDGQIQIKLNIKDVEQINIYDMNSGKGMINIGQVIIANGVWDDSESAFVTKFISQPYCRPQPTLIQEDLTSLLDQDQFGFFNQTYNIIKNQHDLGQFSLSQQKYLQYFPLDQVEPIQSIWFISDFSMTNIRSLEKLSLLLYQTNVMQKDLTLPKAIFIIGQFLENNKQMRQNKVFAQDLLNLLAKYQTLLGQTMIFFMAAHNDPPCSYSLPHPPISLNLLLHNDNLPSNIHSLSNPVRMNMYGRNIQIVRTDIAQELRKNHILENPQFEKEEVCETLWAQHFLGTTIPFSQVTQKWNYSKSLRILDQTDILILADSTLPQFVYTSEINNKITANPGNFSKQGEFLMCNLNQGQFEIQKCKI